MSLVLIGAGVMALIGAGLIWLFSTRHEVLATVIAVLAAVGVVVGLVSIGYSNPRDLTCYVDNKDRAAKDGGSDMRIYTRECGVLKVQDLFWAFRFNSADVYAAIEPGHTYRFHVTGVRIGFFSVFPNVRTAERVS